MILRSKSHIAITHGFAIGEGFRRGTQ